MTCRILYCDVGAWCPRFDLISIGLVWFVCYRYCLGFVGTFVNLRFVTGVFALNLLKTVKIVANARSSATANAATANGTVEGISVLSYCDYSAWPELLLVYCCFAVSLSGAFLGQFFPYLRLSSVDAANLHVSILRQSKQLVSASLSLMLALAQSGAKPVSESQREVKVDGPSIILLTAVHFVHDTTQQLPVCLDL